MRHGAAPSLSGEVLLMNFEPPFVSIQKRQKKNKKKTRRAVASKKQVLVFYHFKLTGKVFHSKSLQNQQKGEVMAGFQRMFPSK